MAMSPRTLVGPCESTLNDIGHRPENKLKAENGKLAAVVTMSSMFLVSLTMYPKRSNEC
jgi:hypothetical protein